MSPGAPLSPRYVKAPVVQAMLQQLVSVGLAVLVAYLFSFSIGLTLILAALLAAMLSWYSNLPRWWVPFQLAFWPALAFLHFLSIPSFVYLVALVALLAVYGGVVFSGVPLFLSSDKATAAVAQLLPMDRDFRFLDVGAGTGGLLSRLDRQFLFGLFEGVERAPLPFAVSWLRSKLQGAQFCVRFENMWQTDLSRYDVVYAYLSPTPMLRLWDKVQREMRPGSLFISNTFEVPGKTPDQSIELHDLSRSTLHVWRL